MTSRLKVSDVDRDRLTLVCEWGILENLAVFARAQVRMDWAVETWGGIVVMKMATIRDLAFFTYTLILLTSTFTNHGVR